ncbi:MAG: thiamine pyrophosphate-dependent enzyme [Solirubrobacteraceae bacterium]
MLDLARRAIRAAQRPVILAGGGVNVAHAQDELLRVAERYGMLVALSVMGKGAFPETHPLALGVASSYTGGSIGHGAAATQALCEADLIMVVGSDLDALTTSGGMWPNAGVTVIRIDNDPTELLSHPAIQIHADAQVALAQLADGDGDLPASHDRQWHAEMQQRVADIRTAIGAYDASGSANGEVSPGRIVTEIHRHLSEGDAIVTDASYSSAWALDRVCQRWPGRFVFAPRGSGVLGWGFPAAIGVKLARPHGQVVCMTGDGGLYFSIGELETAVRLNLDVTVVVLNNGSFGFQRHSDIARQSADPGDLCFGETVSYRNVARAFGWRAERVTSFGEFEEAYPAALADGSPTLIEVMVSEDEIPPILKFDRLRQGMPRMRSVPA